MPRGAGKYDELCTKVREEAKADGAIVIVFNGVLGCGFSVQSPPEITAKLPDIFEDIAKQIRESL